MPTYIILASYTDQGVRSVKDTPKRQEAAKKALKEMGGELKAIYLTMGSYDWVNIVEAPNDEVIARFVLSVCAAGNIRTTTLKAFTEAEYRKIIAGLP